MNYLGIAADITGIGLILLLIKQTDWGNGTTTPDYG